MTKKHFSEKEKLDMVLSVLRNESSKTELCRKRGLSPKSLDQWQRQFLNSERAVVHHHQSRREVLALSAMERENNELRRALEKREHDVFLLKQLLLYR
jgi:transposase